MKRPTVHSACEEAEVSPPNLYVHFPFCRRKCAYCALTSRATADAGELRRHVRRVVREILALPRGGWKTVYFGGGTPALCDLAPVLEAVSARGLARNAEFTVELHPADADRRLLETLAEGGVNRISMGIQSFDDAILKAMGRLHSAAEAVSAFEKARSVFPNCGFDLIAGYPGGGAGRGKTAALLLREAVSRLRPAHASVYTLMREPGTRLDIAAKRGETEIPTADEALDEAAALADVLREAGLERYEISNYARPGAECRHNCAVWNGEDYTGLGRGAHGREGNARTEGLARGYRRETLSPAQDALEREIFSLRTRRGFDPRAAAARHPVLAPMLDAWLRELEFDERQGLVRRAGAAFALTPRGAEVCDSILAGLAGADP